MNGLNHKSDFVHVNGIRLHYLDCGGTGPTLIFLTGMGCSAYIFNNFAPRFTDTFRVLALTRRGQGDSDTPETGYDADTLTEDIRQFMDHLQVEKPSLLVTRLRESNSRILLRRIQRELRNWSIWTRWMTEERKR